MRCYEMHNGGYEMRGLGLVGVGVCQHLHVQDPRMLYALQVPDACVGGAPHAP